MTSKPSTSSHLKASTKKSVSTKEPSTKPSHRSRLVKSEKDDDSSAIIPATQQQTDAAILPSTSSEDQLQAVKKEKSPPKQQPSTMASSTSPKAPLKNTERVFDWLMQNHHHDSNSSMGADQNDDDETLLKRKPDDESLENVSDGQASKTSPPTQTSDSLLLANNPSGSSSMMKNSKNDKCPLSSSYRLQPIRAGGKRDDQNETGAPTNELHPASSSPPPALASTPVSAPPLTPSSASLPVSKEDVEPSSNQRRASKTKFPLSTTQTKTIPLESIASYDQLDVRLRSYPSQFNDHIDPIRLPFPQFAFEHMKTSATSANVLVVLNPKAHLKHSSLGLNNPTLAKHDTLLETSVHADDDSSTTRIPLDERIRLLDKQMYEMNHGQQKSTASSSSSSSSSSLSPATLIEQQNQKNASAIGAHTPLKSVNELVSSLAAASASSSFTSATTAASTARLAQCIQAARTLALTAQTIPLSKSTPTAPASTPFSFPVTMPSVLTSPLPPPPPPPSFPSLTRLPDSSANSILTTFHAAIAQNQMAASKFNTM